MRVGAPFLSLTLHLAVVLAGVEFASQAASRESTPMVLLPVELLAIDDTTNVAPVAAEEPEPEAEIEQSEPAMPEETASPEPAPAEAEPEPTPVPDAEIETPTEVKPAEPKPASKPAKEPSFEDSLAGILQSVEKTQPKTAPGDRKTAADIRSVEDAAPRRGVGDKTRMTISSGDFIRDQLLRRGCWADMDDMPDARRLRAVIRVRFERNGRLLGSPELVEPTRPPVGNPPLQVFIQRAFSALNKCSPYTLPPGYTDKSPPQWIDIDFRP
ncbi:MAG: hypothetical protein R3C52_06030 [Hyphomonadaceae bacterium]